MFSILELLDNFDWAYGIIKPETDAGRAIEEEYKAAYQSILEVFEKLLWVAAEVGTVGHEFNYELHQAVMQIPGTDYNEFQNGFVIEETLIRPVAMWGKESCPSFKNSTS
jgi:molecular chaperone GrpE (heat shock protein)